MIIFILITIFAIYYIAMIASLFKSEGFSIIGLILDIVILTTLIFYYFVGVKSRLLCKMLYNVFTISTYQN
ncbi:DUF5080 family protein [Staphylococcus aureus]|nr:DUF5080 family protein [Staphylococcus aureus]RNB07952.1 DUF5080 family protein [Staphylococcus aureus]RNB15019.1 DUF5080 family protein [Staphylococcus aureus]